MTHTIISLISLALSLSLAFFYLRDRRHMKFNIEDEYINCLLSWHELVFSTTIDSRRLLSTVVERRRQLSIRDKRLV